MATLTAVPAPQGGPTALGVLLDILQRTGWQETTGSADPYLTATGGRVFEPIRVKGATGHPAGRIAVAGDAIGLVTFDYWGRELDRCSWGFITPHNLERALDYMHHALEEAVPA